MDGSMNRRIGTGEVGRFDKRNTMFNRPRDPEKCFQFWARNKGDCASCIRVCVFNKPNTWFHSFVRWHVRNLPQFDSIYLWMDKMFGYGRRIGMEDVW